MKKTLKILLTVLSVVVIATCCFMACSKPDDGGSTTPQNPPVVSPPAEQNQDFTGIVFNDLEIDYDGNPHTITATGVPSGANVVYTNAGPFTEVGEYNITVKITKDGYNDYTKTVTLKIKATTPQDPAKQDFTGIVFNGLETDYDGNPHTITATGMPSGANVVYTNEGPYVDAGEYNITVKITKDGYNDYTKTVTLKINKIDFKNVEFRNESFEFDNKPHSIYIVGTLPTTARVEYSSNVQGVTNTATNIGSYTITATITEKNHNTLVLTAVLKITANDEERFMGFADNGVLYFQNALDNNYFYLYDTNTKQIKKVSSDNVVDIINYGNNGVMYVSKTLVISSIKTVDYTSSVIYRLY